MCFPFTSDLEPVHRKPNSRVSAAFPPLTNTRALLPFQASFSPGILLPHALYLPGKGCKSRNCKDLLTIETKLAGDKKTLKSLLQKEVRVFHQYKSKKVPKGNNQKNPHLTIKVPQQQVGTSHGQKQMNKQKTNKQIKRLIPWGAYLRESGLKLIKSQEDGPFKEYKVQSL